MSNLMGGEWRRKDKERFADGEMLAIRYATGLREVWLYHERICDLIDDEHRNLIRTNLFTLARSIHDDPPVLEDAEWVRSRTQILEMLRDRGRICFDGEVTVYGDLKISLPEETYLKWHNGRHLNGKTQPKDNAGRFAPKTPAQTDHRRNGPNAVRMRTESTAKTEDLDLDPAAARDASNAEAHTQQQSPLGRGVADTALDLTLDLLDEYSKQTRAKMRMWLEQQITFNNWTAAEALAAAEVVAAQIEEGIEYHSIKGFLESVVKRHRRQALTQEPTTVDVSGHLASLKEFLAAKDGEG